MGTSLTDSCFKCALTSAELCMADVSNYSRVWFLTEEQLKSFFFFCKSWTKCIKSCENQLADGSRGCKMILPGIDGHICQSATSQHNQPNPLLTKKKRLLFALQPPPPQLLHLLLCSCSSLTLRTSKPFPGPGNSSTCLFVWSLHADQTLSLPQMFPTFGLPQRTLDSAFPGFYWTSV